MVEVSAAGFGCIAVASHSGNPAAQAVDYTHSEFIRRPKREVCRTHKLNANVLNRWRKEFVEQAPSIFERDAASNQEQERIAE